MQLSETDLTNHLLRRMREVLEDFEADGIGSLFPTVRFADVFDSMAMVEFLGIVADDCECSVGRIEACAGRRFSNVEGLARSMREAGLVPRRVHESAPVASETAARPRSEPHSATGALWLTGIAARLPRQIQSAAEMDRQVGKRPGWLKRRAGISQRHIWANEDPLEAAAVCAAQALRQASVSVQQLGALLAVSEAPPLPVGLAADIHHRLGLHPHVPCFELGGACTGFLSAISLGRVLVPRAGPIVIASVEAHSRCLPLVPGPHGESAALFGDGCVAAVLAAGPAMPGSARLIDLRVYADGSAAELICVRPSGTGGFSLEMEGVSLAEHALHAMAAVTHELADAHHLPLSKLAAVVAHGGNGRMPAMLARRLHLPASKVWSDVAQTGNLGTASVPVAWSSRAGNTRGPVIWTAVGAGLQWGAALWEVAECAPDQIPAPTANSVSAPSGSRLFSSACFQKGQP